MRVLVTTSTYPLSNHEYWGNFIADLNERLEKKGITTITLAPKCPQGTRSSKKRIKIEEFNFFIPHRFETLGCPPGLEHNSRSVIGKIQLPFYIISFFFHLLKAVFRYKPKLIHANWAIPSGFISYIVGKLTKTPVVVTVHGAEVYQSGIRLGVIKKVLEGVDHVVVVSPHIRRCLNLFAKPKFLSMIPNAVNVQDIINFTNEVNIAAVKQRLGISADCKVVFTIRRLVPEKRVQDLIDAAYIVIKNNNDVAFVIAGDGPELSNLTERACNLGIEDYCRFPGAITEKEKLQLLGAADICVQTSIQEGLSLALLEFMAAGTIVITSAAAGQSDTVQHQVTGLLYKAKDVIELARLLEESLSNRNFDAMRKKAVDYVLKNHSSEAHTKRYIKVYQSC